MKNAWTHGIALVGDCLGTLATIVVGLVIASLVGFTFLSILNP